MFDMDNRYNLALSIVDESVRHKGLPGLKEVIKLTDTELSVVLEKVEEIRSWNKMDYTIKVLKDYILYIIINRKEK